MSTVYKREGSPFYQANITVGGVRKRISTQERNRGAAQKKADAIEAEENAKHASLGSISFSDAAATFFKTADIKAKTVDNYKTSFRNIYSVLGDFGLAALEDKHLKHYVRERLKVSGSVAIRRDIAFLSSLISTAKHWDDKITRNPAKDFDKSGLAEAKERNRWLRPEDVEKLLAACKSSQLRLFILLAVDTGMRSGEVCGLTWSEIDLKRSQIVLGNLDEKRTKTGESRIIPLTKRLRDTLVVTKKTSVKDWVFYNPKTRGPITSFKKSWKNAVDKSGLKGLRIHDLRHTYASLGKQAGIEETVLMDIMGHKTRSMVKRYSHTSSKTLREAAEKMESVTKSVTGSTD